MCCYPEQIAEKDKTSESPEIWDAMTLMWCHCKVRVALHDVFLFPLYMHTISVVLMFCNLLARATCGSNFKNAILKLILPHDIMIWFPSICVFKITKSYFGSWAPSQCKGNPSVLCNIGYPSETDLKLKSREISFIHDFRFDCPISLTFCT